MILKTNNELELARQRLADQLDQVLQLRPLPGLAIKINEACQQKDTDRQALIELIQCDAAISSKILSVVNSPVYGCSREIGSLDQAVVIMGFKRLSELAISIASKQVFETDPATQLSGMAIYEHSLACGTMARVLARQMGHSLDEGAAFLSGILHDVGKLFLFDVAPLTCADLYSQSLSETGQFSTVDQEQELFGKCHAQLGMDFALACGLPVSIRTAIAEHHADEMPERSELGRLTGLANGLVKTWGIGNGKGDIGRAANATAIDWLVTSEPSLQEEIRESANEQFQVVRSLFLN